MDRYYDPNDHWTRCDQGHTHWGRNGAAGMLLRHEDPNGIARYFLQQRGPDVQNPGTWSTPGGAIEDHESPQDAAMREATEELGQFPVNNLQHLHTLDHGGWAYHTMQADVPQPFYPHGSGWDPNETSDAGWFTPHEVDELPLHPGFREGWDQYKPNARPDPHREIWSTWDTERFRPLPESGGSTMLWEPGNSGKGAIINGQPHTWVTENLGGSPHHIQYMRGMGFSDDEIYQTDLAGKSRIKDTLPSSDWVTIGPEGHYTSEGFSGEHPVDPTAFARSQPGLKYIPDVDRWENKVWSKLADSTMNWQPGQWGKGLIIDGQLHTWSTTNDDGYFGSPHHFQYLANKGYIPRDMNAWWSNPRFNNAIVIGPQGEYTYGLGKSITPEITRFAEAHPALKYVPDQDKWERRVFTTKVAGSYHPWQPGEYGKGIVTPLGGVVHWGVGDYRDALPAHDEVLDRLGFGTAVNRPPNITYFATEPTGQIRYVLSEQERPGIYQKIENAHPAIHYGPEFGEERLRDALRMQMNDPRGVLEQAGRTAMWKESTPMIPSLPVPTTDLLEGDHVMTPEGPGYVHEINPQESPTLPVSVWNEAQGYHDWYHPDELHRLAGVPEPPIQTWEDEGGWVPPTPEPEPEPEEPASTEPTPVMNPEDRWPDWGQRPPDLPSGTHTDYDWALTRV